ncbi:hypothetical protein OHA77_25975 [Streptosporangium sp. NBC_01639]|uniref:hypothetical protein n=1 Tax=Streptosporangium sp. NBC_01639 TaxID=2975948 RepID=UPI0038653CA1|nr:hypothetical protein OHA77_25975 [Streptosporangium sp. NBC_01639]
MNFCLSDLVPPLRWSDAAAIPLLRDRPDLPDAWWRSLPMARLLAVLSPEELAEILTRIAMEHWPAAAVGDVLPALYVLDPDEADEPCTAIALDRTGSWAGLLSLTGHELRDQPFIQPFPVLNVLFAAVFHRVAHLAPGAGLPAAAAGSGFPAGRPEAAPDVVPPAAAEDVAAPHRAAWTAAEDEPAAAWGGGAADRPPANRDDSVEAWGEAVAGDGAGLSAPAPETGPEAGPEPAPGSGPGIAPGLAAAPVPGSEDDRDGRAPSAPAAPENGPMAVPAAEEPAHAADGEERRPAASLHALLDGVFADLEDKSWAVAQNRLFSDEPATVEALAKLFAVTPDVIQDVEDDLRRRFGAWLASPEAAPYRAHLAEMRKVLGKAAPKARLVAAADWHGRELHSLDVPAWQVVLADLPEYHLVDEWLVEGDIVELRHHTRDVISGAKPPLTMTKALALVTSLGIHPEVSKEWLENVPQLRILGAGQRANGAATKARPKPKAAERPERAERATDGASGGGTEGGPGKAPYRPLKDVSLTRRCFRQPDGRWWLRIDITSEHIEGSECPLPSGFAAYLGMEPGDSRTVNSAVGELILNWQERPVVESLRTLLSDVGAKQGSHLFLTLSDEGVLRARHLPAAGKGVEPTAHALRLVGYTAPGGTPEQAARVIATRVGMAGPVSPPDLLVRLRERGDRDLLSLLA